MGSILAECPVCHQKQAARNKACKCGLNLDDAKKSKRVRYWITYRMPDGKQRRESVATFEGLSQYSVKDARGALSKREVQKKEKRLFDMVPESETTFCELAEWYQSLPKVKKLRSYKRVEIALSNFNSVFGTRLVGDIKLADLEAYQEKRFGEGLSPATVDMEITIAKTMVTKAFDNEKVGGDALKAFRTIGKTLKKGANARTRKLTIDEYLSLIREAPSHLRAAILIGFNTGMRLGEIRKLKWTQLDRKTGFIRLSANDTKEKSPKAIPINHHVERVLKEIPRALNGYVITYKGQLIAQAGGLRRSFKTACKKAGISFGRGELDGITFHDIRRTVKTNMLKAGVSKVYRDTLLGHSLKGMDKHYMVPDENDLIRAMNQYTKWLDDQLNVDQIVDQEQKKVS